MPTAISRACRNWLEDGSDIPTSAFCVNMAHANLVTIQFSKAG
nr:hypothetical protein [Atlantibacter hermannii]